MDKQTKQNTNHRNGLHLSQYGKRMDMKLTILLISILLIGCSKPIEPECQNTTITNNTCEIIYNSTIKEVFIDKPCNCSNNTPYPSITGNQCDISLINQIKILERTIDRWAIADINITINETNTTEVNST